MVGWHHHRLDGRVFGWTPGVGDGQRGLACCDSWGHKESDTTERLSMRTCSSLAVCQQDRHLITLWEVSSFFERNDAKAETPVPWPLHAKS